MTRARWTLTAGMGLTCLAGFGLACDSSPERADSQAFTCRSDPEDLGSRHPRHPRYAEALAREAQAYDLPGAVLVIRDPRGLWSGSHGTADAELGAPMRACQPTRIASITKTITAAAAMQLDESGALALDDPFADYADPRLIADIANAQTATVRDLLANESGIPNYTDIGYVVEVLNHPERTWTEEEIVRRVAHRPADFPAGEGFAYSNTGYILAGQAIEGASGDSMAERLRVAIFGPLDMHSTEYISDRRGYDGIARGYLDLFGTGQLIDSTQSYADTVNGAEGGVISTAYDIRRFLEGLLRNGALLEPHRVERMTDLRPTRRSPGWTLPEFDGYGLGTIGWRTPSGARGIGHSGDEFGYQAFAYYFPAEDVTFVFLVNGSSLQAHGDNLSARVARARDALVEVALE